MRFLFASVTLLFYVSPSKSLSLLRTHGGEAAHGNERRKLNSYVGGTETSGNPRYTDYTASEIPVNQAINDAADFLRSGDKCLSGGTLTNCPSPPNCNFSGQNGAAKLCINRLPSPDKTTWYVAAMVCIPVWENCDKCMCGTITSDTGAGATCKFDGTTTDDDKVHVNCSQLSTATIDGVSFSAPNGSSGSGSSASTTGSTGNNSGSSSSGSTGNNSINSAPSVGGSSSGSTANNSTNSAPGTPGSSSGSTTTGGTTSSSSNGGTTTSTKNAPGTAQTGNNNGRKLRRSR